MMTTFDESIRWRLNGEIELLFFIVGFSGDTADFSCIEELQNQRVKFFDYLVEEGYPITLLDLRFEDGPGVDCEGVINTVLLKLDDISSRVVCLFEGSCGTFDDLTSETNAENIYAFKSSRGILIGIKDEVRLSETWRTNVRAEQRSLKSDLLHHQCRS